MRDFECRWWRQQGVLGLWWSCGAADFGLYIGVPVRHWLWGRKCWGRGEDWSHADYGIGPLFKLCVVRTW